MTPLTEALGMMQAGELELAMQLVLQHLDANASDALAYHLKGLILHRQGDYTAAITAIQQSLKLAPLQASWLLNLGVSQRSAGQLEQAIETFKQAQTCDPSYQPAVMQLALTYVDQSQTAREQGDSATALKLLKEAMQMDRGCVEAQHALAVIHDEMGQRARAISMQKQLLEQLPDEHQSRLHLVDMLQKQGQLEEARQQLTQLPTSPQKSIAQAQLLHVKGDSDAAWTLLQAVPADQQQDINDLTLRAQLAPGQDQIRPVIEQLQAALSEPRPVGQQVLLHFALYQLYDKSAEYDRAFEHARQANNLKSGRYDSEKQGVFVNSLIAVGTWELSTCTDDRPLLIVGMPRSGTSLVEQILGRHPDVYPAGELNHIQNLADQLTVQGRYPGSVDVQTATRLAEVYQQAMDKAALGIRRFTDKMPTNFLHLGLISQMFPKARVIHCTRHPLDTCLSCYFQNFGTFHACTQRLDWLADFYQQYQRLMDRWRATLPIAMLDVSYETLVHSPESEIRRLLEFAGLNWDQRCLAPHESDRTVVTSSNQQVREPIYQRSVARWKRYEKYLGPLQDLNGYCLPISR